MPKKPKEFDGKASQMRDSPWLASEDIEDAGGSVDVTILSCFQHEDVEFDGGRRKPVVYTLAFKGADKQLVLNATNRKSLVSVFGRDVGKWKDQKVQLYVQDGIRMGGKTVTGIRIRETSAKSQ